MSGTKYRKERRAYAGYRGTFAECKVFSFTLNSSRMSLCPLDVYTIDSSNSLKWKQPHIGAVSVAGMMAGSEVGTPITFKFANLNGIKHVKKAGVTPSALELINPETNAQKCIDAGLLLFKSPVTGGVKVLLQNATYGTDDNFVYNRPSVLDASDYAAVNLRSKLESLYVGRKNSFSANDVKQDAITVLNVLVKAEIIVAYKNIVITVVGNTIYLDVTISPVEGIDFILNRITLQSNVTTA
jgi:hypothetical protein